MKAQESITLAIQKNGRLTNDTLNFLRQAGLDFDAWQRRLFASCRNFHVKLIFLRQQDIPQFVETGSTDLGIVGQNILFELRSKVKKLLNLQFGYCSFVIAVPQKSKIKSVCDLAGKTIATSLPNCLKSFLSQQNIKASILPLTGATEIAPALGIADAVADLVTSGSTLALNDLQVLCSIADSEAILIGNCNALKQKANAISPLISRFKAVLSASKYQLLLFNTASKDLSRLKKLLPARSLFFTPTTADSATVLLLTKKSSLGKAVSQIKKIGISQIITLPIKEFFN